MAAYREKLLYLMHVDWRWIKQRPHFLAEGLGERFDVALFYHYASERSGLVQNQTTTRHLPIPRLPLGRYPAVSRMNSRLQRLFFRVLIWLWNPTVIWCSFPTLFNLLATTDLSDRVLVYDCMDDAAEFTPDPETQRTVRAAEQQLLARANLVLVSSQHLLGKLARQGCDPGKLALARNAFAGPPLTIRLPSTPTSPGTDEKLKIGFVGAIGDHLDLATICHCLEQLPSIEFHFIGPVVCDVPTNSGLIFHGPAEHHELAELVQSFHCLILPFQLTELIKGVDPVKLYDYINFNRNIIAVYYPELERFREFVHFYHNQEELVQVITAVSELNNVSYSAARRQRFLEENTWQERLPMIMDQLSRHMGVLHG